MTATEERFPITRPGSGVAVDPRRVMIMRQKKFRYKRPLSDRIAELGLTTEKGRPVRLGPDALGKIETGQRKPSAAAFRALYLALDCTPDELLPGGPVVMMPKAARDRKTRLDYNDKLRRFAIPRGLRYKNPRTKRVYYGKKLREAYALWVALGIVRETGTPEEAEAAKVAYAQALAAVPRAPGYGSSEAAAVAEDVHDLIAS